jgi:peptide/nickel transport system permease protein
MSDRSPRGGRTDDLRVPAESQPPAPDAEPRDAEALATPERKQWRLVVRRFLRHRAAIASLVVLVVVALYAFVGPLLWPYDHTIQRGVPSSVPPNLAHPFGTTSAGQDVFGQVMRGTQQSLKVAFVVAGIGTTIGAIWGAVAGYLGGRVDSVMMRSVDILLVIPQLALVAAILGNVTAGTTWFAVALVLGFLGWGVLARIVRGEVLSLREREFVEAAKAMGASDSRIVFSHLLPNVAGPIIVAATLTMATTILVEAGLSFLGLGIQPPDTSLGLLISDARSAAFTRPWLFYPPGVMIVLIALTVNFIGDGLRDALDPRQNLVRQ